VEYQLVEATPLQKYVYDPNAKNLLQEYGKGKKVAVFHCASGHRARMAKEAGASEVLGLDTSFKQISLAREIELSKEDGIKY
jgi:ribosomal protein L1